VAANVLFVHNGGNWIRGSENALLTLLRGLDRSRITPVLVCSSEPLAALARLSGIRAICCPIPQIMLDGSETRLQFWRWLKTVKLVSALAREAGIRLVYCNGGSACQLGYYVGKLSRLPVIGHVHSPYNRRYILLYRLHRLSKVIAVSQAVRKMMLFKQTFRGTCEVVYNGVDIERFCPSNQRDLVWRERLGLTQDCIVFGQVSSLISRKGIDILLRAFQKLSIGQPNVRLVLIGDGPQRQSFAALSESLSISDKVVFMGETDPLPYYQNVVDVNILASRSDAFPLSLLEASACGLPNIGSAVDGIGEAISDSENGFLFEAGKEEMLAQKMSLLATQPALRADFGHRARQTAVERFSSKQYCTSIERIIEDQLSQSPR
jgi:L-malate glycosyltransferase